MIKLTPLIQEMQVNQPTRQFSSNKELFDFLNKNIREFAEHELQKEPLILLLVAVKLNYPNVDSTNQETFFNIGPFKNLPKNTQQEFINVLVNTGLINDAQIIPYPPGESGGIFWEIDAEDSYGIEYNNKKIIGYTLVKFKGREFYRF